MKRFTSIILILVLCFSFVIPTYAQETTISEIEIQHEIDKEKERVYADVYKQLEEQGMLQHMDTYKEILGTEIEMEVRSKYEVINNPSQRYGVNSLRFGTKTYSFPKGGAISYSTPLNTTVLVTLMTPAASQKYVYNNSTTTSENIINYLIGATIGGKWGAIVAFLLNLDAICTSEGIKAIKNAGGWGRVYQVSDGLSTSTFLQGWKNHPTVIIADDSTGIQTVYGK